MGGGADEEKNSKETQGLPLCLHELVKMQETSLFPTFPASLLPDFGFFVCSFLLVFKRESQCWWDRPPLHFRKLFF